MADPHATQDHAAETHRLVYLCLGKETVELFTMIDYARERARHLAKRGEVQDIHINLHDGSVEKFS